MVEIKDASHTQRPNACAQLESFKVTDLIPSNSWISVCADMVMPEKLTVLPFANQ